ncbi:zf-HC2 domain-containing protein [[Actinomadura] parvosata]|uniref:zf-HC2 domain-containing protein n=1 Tax=[Actinomadura] parvosata TaxID=1955412 RepID=UPI001647E49B
MSANWHLPADLIERYVAGQVEPVVVMSVESHLARCADCRSAVPYPQEWLARSWAGIEDIVNRPHPKPIARALCRIGVPEHLATFLAATPGLSRGWLAGVTSVLVFAIAAAQLSAGHPVLGPHAMLPFLALAPVLPLAGIVLAYRPRVDALHELQAATPMGGSRSLLLRALAVLATAVILTGLATPLLPGPVGLAAAWLLPSLALTAATLALATWLSPLISAAVFAAAWFFAVVCGESLPFSSAAQVLYALAALAFVPVIYLRRARFDPGEC